MKNRKQFYWHIPSHYISIYIYRNSFLHLVRSHRVVSTVSPPAPLDHTRLTGSPPPTRPTCTSRERAVARRLRTTRSRRRQARGIESARRRAGGPSSGTRAGHATTYGRERTVVACVRWSAAASSAGNISLSLNCVLTCSSIKWVNEFPCGLVVTVEGRSAALISPIDWCL